MILEADAQAIPLADNSVDAIITDPPYGLEFMGQEWDKLGDVRKANRGTLTNMVRPDGSQKFKTKAPAFDLSVGASHAMQSWHHAWAVEALRVAKPGAHLVAFGGTRTHHQLMCALEDAGWEIRDCLMLFWVFGSGFPKSSDMLYPTMIKSGVCLSDEPAPHVVATSRFIPLRSSAAKEPIALALAAIQPEGGRGLLMATGGVGASSAATVMWLCGSADEDIFSNIASLWSGESGASSDQVRRYITETEIEAIIGTTIWNSLLRLLIHPTITHRKKIRQNGCRCPASLVVEYSSDGGTKQSVIPTRFVAEPAISKEQLLRLEGLGQNLKPAYEPIILARKPISERNLAANVLRWGTGGLNIDACRIEGDRGDGVWGSSNATCKPTFNASPDQADFRSEQHPSGRWPANVVLSHTAGCELLGTKGVKGDGHHSYKIPEGGGLYKRGLKSLEDKGNPYADKGGMETVEDWRCVEDCPVRLLDEQSGELASGANPVQRHSDITRGIYGAFKGRECFPKRGADSGGASRFFYCSKADRTEREIGMEGLEAKPLHWSSGGKNPGSFQAEGTAKQARNNHPTVKPVDLMVWLCRLVTPSGGLILDPFMGSGSTGIAALRCGFRFVGLDKEQKWVEIASHRIIGDAPLLNQPWTP